MVVYMRRKPFQEGSPLELHEACWLRGRAQWEIGKNGRKGKINESREGKSLISFQNVASKFCLPVPNTGPKIY
jgi:hypothetical protein